MLGASDMSRTSHDGEIEDGKVYTHKRVAVILGRSEDWVLQHVLFPSNMPDGGPPVTKRGSLYFVTGENIRLWMERTATCHHADDR